MEVYEGDYENWDEYEDEEQEEEEASEEGHEEALQPTKEELDYLELRQRLKERFRKKLKKDMGSANSSSVKKTDAVHNDSYGSFFGPSQPVIAQRVIQESKTLLEDPELAERMFRPKITNHKSSASAPVKSKPQGNYPASHPIRLKQKAEMLKQARDYSFLQSEDAQVPAVAKAPPPRYPSAPKSDARSAQVQHTSKPVVNHQRRDVLNTRYPQKPMTGSSHAKPKAVLDRMSKSSVDYRKQLGSNNASGPGRPGAVSKGGMPSKSVLPASAKIHPSTIKYPVVNVPKPNPAVSQSGVRKPIPSHLQQHSNLKSVPSNGQSSAVKKSLVQRKEYNVTTNPKVTRKEILPSSKDHQMKRPLQKHSVRDSFVDERPKAKPKKQPRDEESDGEGAAAIAMIRNMFGYNPKKFRDDDDDSDMEANFEDIMREERKSAKIARKEDEEQRRLIEEEERRERLRLAKKRKLSRE